MSTIKTEPRITSGTDGKIPIMVRVPEVKADSVSRTEVPIVANDSHHLSHSAIIGVLLGALLALIAAALLLWIARRHRRSKTNTRPTISLPLELMDLSAARAIPEADIEAEPADTIDFQNEPIESSPIVPTDSSYRASQISQLEDTSINSNRVSAITASHENNRWSAVSSLRSTWYPSRLKAAARTTDC